MRKRLSGLAALFEEASKCMLSMPGLIGPSLIAVVVLALFLSFWVAVVVCLATANYPGMKPLLPTTLSNYSEAGFTSGGKEPVIKANTGVDYKSFNLVEYQDVDWLRHMLWIYLIGLIWTSEFIFGESFDRIFLFHAFGNLYMIFISHHHSLSTIVIGRCSCLLVFS